MYNNRVGAPRVAVVALAGVFAVPAQAQQAQGGNVAEAGIHKIRHVAIIMQENRSFDHYFGTYPGADGFPMKDGRIGVCISDPRKGACAAPYHDTNDRNFGGSHGSGAAVADIDGGKMDGFVAQAEKDHARSYRDPNDPSCGFKNARLDVMGFHDRGEIPNYWAYADNFVLQDHMFEPNASWSLPAHLFALSEWSAKCSKKGDPQSCVNELERPDYPPDFQRHGNEARPDPDYAWTDLTISCIRPGYRGGSTFSRAPSRIARTMRRPASR